MGKRAKAEGSGGAGNEGLGFEAALEQVESIIDRIESGEAGLEDSIEAYERGMGLLRRCRGILDRAEQRVRELSASDLTADAGERSSAGGSGADADADDPG